MASPSKFQDDAFCINPAVAEWIHAIMMGWKPKVIPLTREGLRLYYRYPLTDFSPEHIVVYADGLLVKYRDIFARYTHSFCLPSGWDQGSCRSTKIIETIGESI